VLLSETLTDRVIATGGSAVYSEPGMLRLKEQALVVFLDVCLEELEKRVNDFATRGIARRPDQSFAELFTERRALYNRYADIVIECSDLSIEESLHAVIKAIESR